MQEEEDEDTLAQGPQPPTDSDLEAWLASPHWPPSTGPAVDDRAYQSTDFKQPNQRASIAPMKETQCPY